VRASVRGRARAAGCSSGCPAPGLKAVVFDMDGTLTQEGALDYAEMYRRAGAPPGCKNILEWVETLDAAGVSGVKERGRQQEAVALTHVSLR
jgi:phosphoglycolate phosphatase-like HAD superfamily hydrolase